MSVGFDVEYLHRAVEDSYEKTGVTLETNLKEGSLCRKNNHDRMQTKLNVQ